MKRLWTVVLAVAVLMVWAVPTFAQWGEETTGNNLRVRIGAFFPSKDISRDEANAWFTAGVDYVLTRGVVMSEDYEADLGVSVDYYGTGNVYHIPVLLNYWGKLGGGFSYTAGVGVGFSKRPVTEDTKTGFAYTIGLGYDLAAAEEGGSNLFIDVRYNGLTGVSNEFDGFSVAVGLRL